MSKDTATISLSRFKELEHKEDILNELKEKSKNILVQEYHTGCVFTHHNKTLYTIKKNDALKDLHKEWWDIKQDKDLFENKLKKIQSRNLIQRILNRPIS